MLKVSHDCQAMAQVVTKHLVLILFGYAGQGDLISYLVQKCSVPVSSTVG